MSLNKRNCLKGSFQDYQLRNVKKLVEQLPEGRRAALAEEIQTRAFLCDVENVSALRVAVARLKGERIPRKATGNKT